jgi:hypothetical protein
MWHPDSLDTQLRTLTHERAGEHRFGRRYTAIRLVAQAIGRVVVAILAVIGGLVVLGAVVDALMG